MAAISTETLYEQDYYLWLETTAKLLREGKLTEIALDSLIEQIEDMGRHQKHALESNLVVLLMHLLKDRYQVDKRSSSWRATIVEHRRRLLLLFKHSPSLKRYFEEVFIESYQDARLDAAIETQPPLDTFPVECRFTQEEVLNPNFLPQ